MSEKEEKQNLKVEEVQAETCEDAALDEAQPETVETELEKIRSSLDAAELKSKENEDKYARLMAEFQNYKKRVTKEKQETRAYANEKIVVELLTVLDNFERALENNDTEDHEGYAKGMNLIFNQLKTLLEKTGLEEIEALGAEFDPRLHNAVMTSESDKYESETVCDILQKGYLLNKKVIRPAMVTVAK